MTKATERYDNPKGKVVIASDFTPPRSGDIAVLERLRDLEVDFISVAYNPGKLVRADSVTAAYAIKEHVGTDVMFNLATRDMNKVALGSRLLGAQMLGLENVVVLQGDPFNERELAQVTGVGDFTATELIKAIRSMNEGLDYRGAKLGTATDFCIGATLDLDRPLREEAALAHRKVEAGADYFITQPLYHLAKREEFLELYEALAREPLAQPVFWGLQVLEKGGIYLGNVPAETLQDLERGRSGVDIALDLLQDFVELGIRGVYLVPPILKGGARDYEAAKRLLKALEQ